MNTEIGQATDADANMDVYVRNGKIIVVVRRKTLVTVCDVQGRTIYREKVQGNVSIPLTKGVYVLNGRKVMRLTAPSFFIRLFLETFEP